jgi:hypothetical protein
MLVIIINGEVNVGSECPGIETVFRIDNGRKFADPEQRSHASVCGSDRRSDTVTFDDVETEFSLLQRYPVMNSL